MSGPLILTHCGQLGDFVYTWPIAAHIHKTTGRKIHWVLTQYFGPFRFVETLLRQQAFTQAVTLVPYRVAHYGHGGQPYHFDPSKFGVSGDYLNLGFRGFPNKFITAYVAEEHTVGWDADWVLDLGASASFDPKDGLAMQYENFVRTAPEAQLQRVLTPRSDVKPNHWFEELINTLPPYDEFFKWVLPVLTREPDLYTEHANFPRGVRRIDLSKSVLHNAQWMRASERRHCFYSSMAVILYFARVPFILYRQPGHPGEERYFPDRTRYELRQLPA